MKILTLILICVLSCVASAGGDCRDELSKADRVLQLTEPQDIYRRQFRSVELRLPKADKPFEYLDLEFVKWLEIEEKGRDISLIGLTDQGILYHVISFGNQKAVARRVGSRRVYTDFLVTDKKDLIAVDVEGFAYLYRSGVWVEQGVDNKLVSKSFEVAGLLSVAGFTAINVLQGGPTEWLQSVVDLKLYELAAPLAASLGVTFTSLLKYELAVFSDGFERIDWTPDSGRLLRDSDLAVLRSSDDLSLEFAESLRPERD